MRSVKRALSSVLLACGIVLVFVEWSTVVGSTPASVVVSVAAIAALLYAGTAWFGSASGQFSAPGANTVMVFDRLLHVVSGPATGGSLLAQFPAAIRPELEMRCRMALHGEHTHFSYDHAGTRVTIDIAPVRTAGGVVLFGVLIAGQGRPIVVASARPVTTVA